MNHCLDVPGWLEKKQKRVKKKILYLAPHSLP